MRAYVGFGANLGEREATIARAIDLLGAEPGMQVTAVSTLRETEPWGPVEQPGYLNDLEPYPQHAAAGGASAHG